MNAVSTSRSPAPSARLDVRFTASWEVIDDTREYLIHALTYAVPQISRREQIGIAAHELMENAFRYSPAMEVSINVAIADGVISIVAENESTPEHIADLTEQVRELAAAADPLAHYRQKMLQCSDRTEGSGLGLARIRWEASMSVDFEVDGSRVRVRASGSIE